MSKFEFSGNDLIERWEIRGFQLFDYLEKGLLQPYDATTGNMIIDRNTDHGKKVIASSKYTPPLTVEQQEKKQRVNQRRDSGFVYSGRQTKRKAQALYNSYIMQLNDYIQKSFTLSRDKREAAKQIRKARRWVFKTEDVLGFEKNHGLYESNKAEEIKPFPCEAGTQWDDVKITLTANDTVKIETPQGKGKYTYHELGMADKRTGDKPKEVWATLSLFAKQRGIFPQENQLVNVKALVSKAKHLNSHLKKLFGIKESIFKYHYKKHKRYETRILFSDQTLSSEPEPQQDKSPFYSELYDINKKFGNLKESV